MNPTKEQLRALKQGESVPINAEDFDQVVHELKLVTIGGSTETGRMWFRDSDSSLNRCYYVPTNRWNEIVYWGTVVEYWQTFCKDLCASDMVGVPNNPFGA